MLGAASRTVKKPLNQIGAAPEGAPQSGSESGHDGIPPLSGKATEDLGPGEPAVGPSPGVSLDLIPQRVILEHPKVVQLDAGRLPHHGTGAAGDGGTGQDLQFRPAPDQGPHAQAAGEEPERIAPDELLAGHVRGETPGGLDEGAAHGRAWCVLASISI